jgi:hypothetical protein
LVLLHAAPPILTNLYHKKICTLNSTIFLWVLFFQGTTPQPLQFVCSQKLQIPLETATKSSLFFEGGVFSVFKLLFFSLLKDREKRGRDLEEKL